MHARFAVQDFLLPDESAEWRSPPENPRLSAGEIHVWRQRLLAGEDNVRATRALSPDEVARAARFVHDVDRDRYVSARAFTRAVLAAYTGVPPATLRFEYGPQGKPALTGVGTGIGFNVSHSGNWVLCAVALSSHVGVDVEEYRPMDPGELEAMLGAGEAAGLARSDDATEALLRVWTRKEAVLKAIGEGLSLPPHVVRVGLAGALVHVPGTRDERWQLADVSPEEGYFAAVAVPEGTWRLTRWDGFPGRGLQWAWAKRHVSNSTRAQVARPFWHGHP